MNITTIRTAAETLVGSILGGSYKVLPYLFDIEGNDGRSLGAGYAVLWGAGAISHVVDQVLSIEQELKVTITSFVGVRNDDEKMVATMDTLYTAVGTIINRFSKDRLDLPGIIQQVEMLSMSEPKGLGDGRDYMMIDLTFRVRYMNT